MIKPQPPHRRTLFRKLRQNWTWIRNRGWSDLIEEHDLDVRVRWRRGVRKATWRWTARDPRESSTPIFLLGAQRSGTNMLVHGLDEAPQTQVYNEGDRKAFREFRLRPLDAIDSLVEASAADFVLFKPLCDSHRALELLEHFRPNGRVIWAYRDMDERVRSALAKFGDSNLRALRAFAIGEGAVGWQVQGLSAENADLIKSFDFDRLSAESGAALFWYVRNSLYFEMSLDMRQDAILASYDQILADPERIVGALCSFLGLPYRPEIVAHVKRRRRPPNSPLAIDPGIRERCAELQERLDALSRYQIASLEARTP